MYHSLQGIRFAGVEFLFGLNLADVIGDVQREGDHSFTANCYQQFRDCGTSICNDNIFTTYYNDNIVTTITIILLLNYNDNIVTTITIILLLL